MDSLTVLAEQVAACTLCTELAAQRTNTVFGQGNARAPIFLCGEAPGQKEDAQGLPFVGQAGHLLDRILSACELRREEVYISNALKCRPPGNRKPSDQELANCNGFLRAQLHFIRPRYLVCLGATAVQAVLGIKGALGPLRGRWLTYHDGDLECKVIATWHPAYLLRQPQRKKETWEDLQLLLTEIRRENR